MTGAVTRPLCLHCDVPRVARIGVVVDVPGWPGGIRISRVCKEHLEDELAELRHLGFTPRIMRS